MCGNHVPIIYSCNTTRSSLPFTVAWQTPPSGPKGRFLVGNLSDLPKDEAETAKAYVKWREDYGAYLVIRDCLLF